MPGDDKTEKDAAKSIQTLSKDLESLPKKDKADLDKGNKLVRDLEKDAKQRAKSGGKGRDKHADASDRVRAIWEKIKKQRVEAMKSLDQVAGTCKAHKGKSVIDTVDACEPAVSDAVKRMVVWMGLIDDLEKAAKGLDPKSPMARGVKDSIKIQRNLNDAAARTVRTNFNKLLHYRSQLKKVKH